MAHTRADLWKQRKLEQKKQAERMALEALRKHSTKHKNAHKTRTKRKSPEEILELLPRRVRRDWMAFKIREPGGWVSKSYNEEKQLMDFIRWLFCEYHVPSFMFNLFMPDKPIGLKHRRGIEAATFGTQDFKKFMAWFIAIGQGYSFAKEASGTLTKKEAHLFLNAPAKNTPIKNIWWARCESRGLPENMTNFIVQRSPRLSYRSKFWISFLDFVRNNKDEINTDTLQELLDFLPNHRRRFENFSLKGRTLNSLIQLSNEWHREQQTLKHGRYQSWDGFGIKDWTYKEKKEKVTWSIRQLTTSKELYAEGRRMRHCVYRYVAPCVAGRTAIFTLESLDFIGQEDKHLTIEVTNYKTITQAKGRLNRRPTGREYNIMHKWAVANGLTMDQWV